MAKNTGAKSGHSKIRFIMLEADLSEGDLSQVTQAIQNALRPAQAPTRIIQTSSARGLPADDPELIELEGGDELVEDQSETPKPRAARTSKPRVAKTPKILDDLDLKSDPSLEDFVSAFDLKTDVDRYLVIALWFRDARDIPAITVEHVYTCFRSLGWSTASTDFSKPLRNLRDEQSMKGGSKDGFTLTLIGAGKIEKKKRS